MMSGYLALSITSCNPGSYSLLRTAHDGTSIDFCFSSAIFCSVAMSDERISLMSICCFYWLNYLCASLASFFRSTGFFIPPRISLMTTYLTASMAWLNASIGWFSHFPSLSCAKV